MARDEAPPWARGESFYNSETIDTANLGGVNLEGKEFVFEPNSQDNYSGTYSNASTDVSGRPIRVRVVRNLSGVNLKPARLVHYKADDPYETHIDGYTYALGDRVAGVVDENLPAAGVPTNDLFYIVVEGPSKVTNTHTSATTFAIGDALVPAVGGASSLTDDLGGRVAAQSLAGATTVLGNNIQGKVGYAAAVSSAIDTVFNATIHRYGR